MMKYSPRFPKQVPLCWLSCKTASSFPHRPQVTLASLQPPSEFQFTTLTCGQLYLDCKVMRGDCCTFSIAVVLPMLANTPELFLSSKKCLTLTSTPCNGSAGRRSPGLWASDLQILLLQPSWQWFARKNASSQVSCTKTYSSLVPMTDVNHLAVERRAALLGLSKSDH